MEEVKKALEYLKYISRVQKNQIHNFWLLAASQKHYKKVFLECVECNYCKVDVGVGILQQNSVSFWVELNII